MNLDNSGSTVVFDPKTQQSIDVAKNRIEELNNDIARLQKQRQIGQAEVKKLQDEAVYLEGKAELLRPEVDILLAQVSEAKKQLAAFTDEMTEKERNMATEKKLIQDKWEEFVSVQDEHIQDKDMFEQAKESFNIDKSLFEEEKEKYRSVKQTLVDTLDTL